MITNVNMEKVQFVQALPDTKSVYVIYLHNRIWSNQIKSMHTLGLHRFNI